MEWTELHATILGSAFEKVLGRAEAGSMSYVRCLTPDVVEALAGDAAFAVSGWQVRRVADAGDETEHTITADRAVEMRESKGDAALLLVDTARAGAGMDGIYGAGREVEEANLFTEALRLAGSEVTSRRSDSREGTGGERNGGRRADSRKPKRPSLGERDPKILGLSRYAETAAYPRP